MKRILTSTLILLVLTLSVHPILSMHFCQGELHSFSVNVKSDTNACCSSSFTNGNSFDILSTDLTESSESCCSTTNLEVVTDNFILKIAEQNHTPTVSTYLPGWFSSSYLIDLTAPETTLKNNFNFTSQGFYLKTLTFLSLICVYRL